MRFTLGLLLLLVTQSMSAQTLFGYWKWYAAKITRRGSSEMQQRPMSAQKVKTLAQLESRPSQAYLSCFSQHGCVKRESDENPPLVRVFAHHVRLNDDKVVNNSRVGFFFMSAPLIYMVIQKRIRHGSPPRGCMHFLFWQDHLSSCIERVVRTPHVSSDGIRRGSKNTLAQS